MRKIVKSQKTPTRLKVRLLQDPYAVLPQTEKKQLVLQDHKYRKHTEEETTNTKTKTANQDIRMQQKIV